MWYSLFSLKFNIFITTSINYLNKKSVCDLNLACNGKWQGPIQWCQCCRQERSHRFVRSLISVNDALQGYVNQVPQELKENRKCKEYKELPADVAVVLTEKNIARMSCDSLELVTHLADIHQKATINLCKGETCEFASSRCPIYKYDTVCKHSMRGSPWVRKFGYLCIRRILVTSRDCTSTWPPVYSTRTPTWNNSIIRYGRPNETQGFIWQEMAWLHGLLEKTTTNSSLFRGYFWCLLSSG